MHFLPCSRVGISHLFDQPLPTPAPESVTHHSSAPEAALANSSGSHRCPLPHLLNDALLGVSYFIRMRNKTRPHPTALLSCDHTPQDFCTTTRQEGHNTISHSPQHCSILAERAGVQDCTERARAGAQRTRSQWVSAW